jgi:hypothetical protein
MDGGVLPSIGVVVVPGMGGVIASVEGEVVVPGIGSGGVCSCAPAIAGVITRAIAALARVNLFRYLCMGISISN